MLNTQKKLWLACALSTIALGVSPLQAQTGKLSPKEIGQILDATIRAVLPDTMTLSRVPISKRSLRVDYERTLNAFGNSGGEKAAAAMNLQTKWAMAAPDLFNDCDQIGSKPCSKMGWQVYTYISPVSVTGADATIRLSVTWAEHDPDRYMEGQAPTPKVGKRVPLASFSSEVQLRRSSSGTWQFLRVGRTTAS